MQPKCLIIFCFNVHCRYFGGCYALFGHNFKHLEAASSIFLATGTHDLLNMLYVHTGIQRS